MADSPQKTSIKAELERLQIPFDEGLSLKALKDLLTPYLKKVYILKTTHFNARLGKLEGEITEKLYNALMKDDEAFWKDKIQVTTGE